MSNEMMMYIVIGILAIILVGVGIRFYLKNKKPTKKPIKKSGIAINELIGYLGGSQNILEVSSSLSKVTVKLANAKTIDPEGIKKLGATGIVQNEDKLSMIFGKVSEAVEVEVKEKI